MKVEKTVGRSGRLLGGHEYCWVVRKTVGRSGRLCIGQGDC